MQGATQTKWVHQAMTESELISSFCTPQKDLGPSHKRETSSLFTLRGHNSLYPPCQFL